MAVAPSESLQGHGHGCRDRRSAVRVDVSGRMSPALRCGSHAIGTVRDAGATVVARGRITHGHGLRDRPTRASWLVNSPPLCSRAINEIVRVHLGPLTHVIEMVRVERRRLGFTGRVVASAAPADGRRLSRGCSHSGSFRIRAAVAKRRGVEDAVKWRVSCPPPAVTLRSACWPAK